MIRLTRRAGLRDMAQRIGTCIGACAVEEAIRIGRAADTDRIHHHKESAGHDATRPWISGGSSGAVSAMLTAASTARMARSAASGRAAWMRATG